MPSRSVITLRFMSPHCARTPFALISDLRTHATPKRGRSCGQLSTPAARCCQPQLESGLAMRRGWRVEHHQAHRGARELVTHIRVVFLVGCLIECGRRPRPHRSALVHARDAVEDSVETCLVGIAHASRRRPAANALAERVDEATHSRQTSLFRAVTLQNHERLLRPACRVTRKQLRFVPVHPQ
jgi:hypothetical protein